MNKGGFSWKRLMGITRAKQKVSKKTGIPLTKGGRQRKLGKVMSGGGCVILFLPLLTVIIALAYRHV